MAKLSKLETIKYFLSKISADSAEGMACIREILEDFEETIDTTNPELIEMIKSCNS